MKTFADIKRALQVGATVTMLAHDWFPTGKLINVPRKVVKTQSNAVQFEGGSWLYWSKAGDYTCLSENCFKVRLNPDSTDKPAFMVYEVQP